MDNIRATINTLFSQINSTTILLNLFRPCLQSDMLGITEEMFCQKFAIENKCYTSDQVHELYNLVTTEWMKYPLSYKQVDHPEKNLFYILLHYTINVLIEQNGMPVCKYRELLRWRALVYNLGEDLFTTSFLAFQDILSRRERRDLQWFPVIAQDNPSIDYILRKGVTDLHFHLRGSSINYELNWLSLMNTIRNRKATFERLKKCLSYKVSTVDKEKWDSFYLLTWKACAIRYYLYLLLTDEARATGFKSFLFDKILTATDDDGSNQVILQYHLDLAKFRTSSFDYAIPTSLRGASPSVEEILSGERWLLYEMFHRIYSQVASYQEKILFYVYILQREQMRKELVQLNERGGFGNFSDYERRKEVFIENISIYENLVPKLAVEMAFRCGHLKYLECRITPKMTSSELLYTIIRLDRQIEGKKATGCLGLEPFGQSDNLNYYYVLHFIKKADLWKRESHDMRKFISYRHSKLRQEIRAQGIAILDALKKYPQLRKRIVGIDAANTELYCRPEVFAPVYRYMKRFDANFAIGYSLKYTYHVGEDFWDVTDGLRAIDEAIMFLNLDSCDRLGHALVLGIDVRAYYAVRNNRVVMSKQNIMDNVMWLICKAHELDIQLSENVSSVLLQIFGKYYDEVYINAAKNTPNLERRIQGRNVHVYKWAWLLRGDDPALYKYPEPSSGSLPDYSLWGITARNYYNEDIIYARKHECAHLLYHLYHYSPEVRYAGEEKCEIKVTPEIVQLIELIQQKMCYKIASLHLGIEANITSNRLIGSMNKYIQHPIVRLNQQELLSNNGISDSPQLSVSINTDDRGIFDTSIEAEYALLALALEKEKNEQGQSRYLPRHIYEWLNNIRKMGFEQQFVKGNASKY